MFFTFFEDRLWFPVNAAAAADREDGAGFFTAESFFSVYFFLNLLSCKTVSNQRIQTKSSGLLSN